MEEALQFHQLIMIFLQVIKLSEILQISLVNVCDLIISMILHMFILSFAP